MSLSPEKITALKSACKAVQKKPLPFFYCLAGPDGEPTLLIGKTISNERKALQKAAKKKRFVKGRVARADNRLRFVTDTPTANKFAKNLKTYFGAAIPDLKKAEVKAPEPAEEGEEAAVLAPAPPPGLLGALPNPQPAPKPGTPPDTQARPPKPSQEIATERVIGRNSQEIGVAAELNKSKKFKLTLKANVRLSRKDAKNGGPVALENKLKKEFTLKKGWATKLQTALGKITVPTKGLPIIGGLVFNKVDLALFEAEVGKEGAGLNLVKITASLAGDVPPDWGVAGPAHKISIQSAQLEGKWVMDAATLDRMLAAEVERMARAGEKHSQSLDSLESRKAKLDAEIAQHDKDIARLEEELKKGPGKKLKGPQRAEWIRQKRARLQAVRKGRSLAVKNWKIAAGEIDKVMKALQTLSGRINLAKNKLASAALRKAAERLGKVVIGKVLVKLIPGINLASTLWDLVEIMKWGYDAYMSHQQQAAARYGA